MNLANVRYCKLLLTAKSGNRRTPETWNRHQLATLPRNAAIF